jgi:hypothetical protein
MIELDRRVKQGVDTRLKTHSEQGQFGLSPTLSGS